MTIPTVVCGRWGRMATLLGDAVSRAPDLSLAAHLSLRRDAADLADPRAPGRQPGPPDGRTPRIHAAKGWAGAAVATSLASIPGPPPVVVDFTAPESTGALLEQALSSPCALVIGTSGLTPEHRKLLDEVGRNRTVVAAANYSLALLAVARFIRDLSAGTGEGWDAGVVDIHFAGKRDRPSATADYLARQWQEAGASGSPEPETASFRLGDAVSEHRLLAAGPGEHVEVLHRVADRRAFLPGVLRSVRFAAAEREPGVYSLEDVACDAAAADR